MSQLDIITLSENALLVQFDDQINEHTHQRIMALYRHINNAGIAFIKDIIPAYTSVTIVFDLMAAIRHTTMNANEYMQNQIQELIDRCDWNAATSSRLLEVPVCYDASLAPDLERMAQAKQLSVDGIIRIHTSKTYKVYMLGFLPGFAYMGHIDDAIAMHRLRKPRLNVSAGSVGIAGNQTGIYPLPSPGGWNIIGQTPLQIFDASKEEPCFFQPGDIVQFISISLQEFYQLVSAE